MAVLRKSNVLLAVIALSLFFSGCSLIRSHEQSSTINNIGKIEGIVTITSSQRGDVIVLRYRDENGIPVLISKVTASEKGDYRFNVAPGTFYLASFVDLNADGQYQQNEHGNFWGSPTSIVVSEKEIVSLPPIIISGLLPKPETEIKAREEMHKIIKNIGLNISLTNPIFTNKNYSMGMWRPVDFLEQIGGGLFFLQPYKADKVPVLFIHGVNGGPTVWQEAIESLDEEKFQPWVLYYPSGLRLETISDYLVQAIVTLQKQYHFDQFSVAAHSMGGLVTHSFVEKYREQYPNISKNLKLVMTVNSSLGGMKSAASGVKHSPIVLPVWNDMAPGSEFLKEIHDSAWPEDIDYYLIFSFKTGSDGDGVVSLRSQIPSKFQIESRRMYGFNNGHVGTLKDSDFLLLFNKLLEDNLGG